MDPFRTTGPRLLGPTEGCDKHTTFRNTREPTDTNVTLMQSRSYRLRGNEFDFKRELRFFTRMETFSQSCERLSPQVDDEQLGTLLWGKVSQTYDSGTIFRERCPRAQSSRFRYGRDAS